MTRKYKTKDYLTRVRNYSKVDETTGCWIWTKKSIHRQGYAFARYKNEMKTVIRSLAIELNLFPDINFNSRITNKSDNKLCVNPEHIICCTHTEVMHRRYEKHGSPYKFDKETIDKIYTDYNRMKANQITGIITKLTVKYNCSPTCMYNTINRKKMIETQDTAK